MPRSIHKLTFREIKTLKKPKRHSDGGNLYLKITPDGARHWVFLYDRGDKQTEMGLGSAPVAPDSLVSATTEAARVAARVAREDLAAGRAPLEARDARLLAAKAADQKARTFGEVADEHIQVMSPQWKSAKHKDQWHYTLGTLAEPLRSMPVNQVETSDVLAVLKPLWQTTPETAYRLRGRVEAVLDRATANKERQGENPARWRGHLALLLPKRQKLARGHHAAMHYSAVPEFMGRLRLIDGLSARALELCILTATRTAELLGAQWDEIDLDKREWIVPAIRMKAGRPHHIPLSGRAATILAQLHEIKDGKFVFPSPRTNKAPLSNMAMSMALRRMGHSDVTTHGYRSSFKDWSGEQTSFSNEVSEAALAHIVKDKSEAAYRRATMFDKRKLLMEAWAQYCEPKTDSKVVPLSRPATR